MEHTIHKKFTFILDDVEAEDLFNLLKTLHNQLFEDENGHYQVSKTSDFYFMDREVYLIDDFLDILEDVK